MPSDPPALAEAPADGEGLRTVVVALAANLGIAAAKAFAALLTRSSAMLAEAFHAGADTGNQLLPAGREPTRAPAARRGPPDGARPGGVLLGAAWPPSACS